MKKIKKKEKLPTFEEFIAELVLKGVIILEEMGEDYVQCRPGPAIADLIEEEKEYQKNKSKGGIK